MSVSYHTIIILSHEIWDMGYRIRTYGTTIAHAPHRISIRGGKTNNYNNHRIKYERTYSYCR